MNAGICLLLTVNMVGGALPLQRASPPSGPPAGISAEVRQPSGDLEVTLQNNRAVAIEAWSFQVTWRGTSPRDVTDEVTTDTYPTIVLGSPGSDGPIGPGERRVVNLGPHPRAVIKVTTLLLALYADLSYEGQPATRDGVLRQRERDAAELDAWLTVLAEVRSKRPEEKELLRGRRPTLLPSKLQRFPQMFPLDRVRSVEVGDRSGDPQHAIVAAGGQREARERAVEHAARGSIERRACPELAALQPRVETPVARKLPRL